MQPTNETVQASDYAKHITAAEAGNPEAQYLIGQCCEVGIGTAQSDEQALRWFRLAAEQGHAAAQHQLGYAFHLGKGVVRNEVIAREWFRKSSDQGNPAGRTGYAVVLLNGSGGPADASVARKYAHLAANDGHVSAQALFGILCLEGRGGDADQVQALLWLNKAAEGGFPDAMAVLGNFYGTGKYGPIDKSQAVLWYERAANAGHAEAAAALGTHFEAGDGVKQDLKRAFHLYTRAAKGNSPLGLMRLGICYAYGRGVNKDRLAAHEYFVRAQALGVKGAGYYEFLTRKIGPKEFAFVIATLLVFCAVIIGAKLVVSKIAPFFAQLVPMTLLVLFYAVFGLGGRLRLRRSLTGRTLTFQMRDLYLASIAAAFGVIAAEAFTRFAAVGADDHTRTLFVLWVAAVFVTAQFVGSAMYLSAFQARRPELVEGFPRWASILSGSCMGLLGALLSYVAGLFFIIR